ncbi:MAG: SH3 domain-containing protein [Anaerolineales bacterium]|nr:SH3 domain-containing protein [Anaerolineales bacterium]
MKHRQSIGILICAVILLGLPGCGPAADPCEAADLTAPGVISGTGPSTSGITEDLTPEFPWTAAYDCDFDGFRVEVALDGDFTAPGLVIGTTGPDAGSWTPSGDLQPASHYQWRVAAYVGGVVGDYSPERSFFTGPACADDQRWTVTLESPGFGTVVAEEHPALAWSYPDASCLPEGYQFRVQNQDTSAMALSGEGGPYAGFETNVPFLDDCQLYYWWVQPVIGGTASEHYVPAYFVTDFHGTCPGMPCDAAGLVSPQPLSPLDGSAWTGNYPIVRWDYPYPVCLAGLDFHAEVARDLAFTDLVVYGDVPGGWLTFDPAAAVLDDCTTYYWHVAADTGGTVGPYSTTWSFTTDLAGTCPGGVCDVTGLPAPTPLSPAEGADWAGTSPVVTWGYSGHGCEALITFHAEVARNLAFTDLVVYGDIPGEYNTFDPAAVVLDDCTTYYWHVAATTANGEGPFSETRAFRTNFSGACDRSTSGQVNQDAVCRSGPSLDHPILLYLTRGQGVEVVGRNAPGSWLVVIRPDGFGECWISAGLVNTEEDVNLLAVRTAPPAPGPTDDGTGQGSDEPAGSTATPVPTVDCSQLACAACMANPACIWTNTQGTCVGYCSNR